MVCLRCRPGHNQLAKSLVNRSMMMSVDRGGWHLVFHDKIYVPNILDSVMRIAEQHHNSRSPGHAGIGDP